MKKRLFFITCLMMLCSIGFSGNHWTMDSAPYENYMTIIAEIKIDGVPQTNTDIELAAFRNGELRGATNIQYDEDFEIFYAELNVYGKNNEDVEFKLWDPSIEKELVTQFYATINLKGIGLGSLENPIEMDFYLPYWNVEEVDSKDNMSITGEIYINEVYQHRNNVEIAVLYGDNVIYAERPSLNEDGDGDRYQVYLGIKGVDGWELTFKLYDCDGGQVLETSNEKVTFETDAILGEEEPYVINFIDNSVAKIVTTEATTKYSTLEAAVEAYSEGTIVMLKDVEDADTVTVGKNVTIDFAGFTYNGALNLHAILNVVREDETKAGTATSIVLNDGAQINHSYALATTIVRNVAGTASGWGTLSAPTKEGNVAFNYVCDHDQDCEHRHDFYQYVESEDLEWKYIGGDVSNDTYTCKMEVGRGYLYANAADVTMNFAGTLNMENVKFTLSYTDKDLPGFNMIGNPYTHNISLNHLQGSIANAFYSVATNGAWLANADAPENIAPFQAFLVQTSETGAEDGLIINKTATRERGVSEGRLKINVANSSYNDVAYVLFEEGIGLRKIAHFNEEIPMVSVSVEGKEYAAATMSKDVTEIPVSFKAMTMGQYTISVEAQDCEFDALYLTDKLTGEKVNLNIESYTFMATSNDNPNRFVLTTRGTTDIEQNEEYFVYVSNEEIRFNNINGQVNVRIYDMLGRPVAEYDVYESATISTSSFEAGMYILQMTDENGVRTQKVLVD